MEGAAGAARRGAGPGPVGGRGGPDLPDGDRDPDRFRQGLEAVRALVDELRRTAGTFDDLLAVEAQPTPLLAVLPGGGSPVPVDLVVQAASRARGRELRGGPGRRAPVAAVAAAGRRIAVGGAGRAGADRGRGRRHVQSRHHLASDRTLVAAVVRTRAPIGTGCRSRSAGEARRDETFADPSSWMAARDRWRAEIESS